MKKKKWLQWNIGNIVMIVNKCLQMNQILVLNNPLGIDMPLNKAEQTKPIYRDVKVMIYTENNF